MDKRRVWRQQEQELVERWNAAAARHNSAQAELARHGQAASQELVLQAARSQAEMEAIRREVARLKVQFNQGVRY